MKLWFSFPLPNIVEVIFLKRIMVDSVQFVVGSAKNNFMAL